MRQRKVYKYRIPIQDAFYKHRIAIQDAFEIHLSQGAEILHVDTQGDGVFLWARVFPGAAQETRRFIMRGTGHECADGHHVGTVQLGGFVWHIFDVTRVYE